MNRVSKTISGVAFVVLALVVFPRLSRADDWLPISPEDLAMKDNPKQPGADAMVLYREVTVDAKPSTVDTYFRVKIFTAAGVKEQADVEIQYDKSQESIPSVRARTIRPDGSIVQFEGKPFDKEIVKGSGIKYLAKTFTMPDVEPGCIIEYRYREQYDPNAYQNFYWTIQSNLFTRLARFSTKFDDRPEAPAFAFRTYAMPGGLLPQKDGGRYVLEVRDLAGIEDETLMPPSAAQAAAVDFYYYNYSDPRGETTDQFWKRIGKAWSDNVDHFVGKKKELAAEVSQDVNGSDSPETKLRKLYARVLKIRNLDMEDDKSRKEEKHEKLKPNSNVDDVLKHGYGDGTDVSFLLIGLARSAGFEATDVRVASRTSRIFIPQRQATYDLNSQLVWVRAGGKEYYLDPAARFYPFGVLPWYEAATNGMRITKDGAQMIETPAARAEDATIARHVDVTVANDMEINGRIQVDFTGQEAAIRRFQNRDEDEAGRKKVLGGEIKGWLSVESTFEVNSITNWDQTDEPLHVEGTVKAPALAGGSVQRMLLPLDLFQTTEVGYFQSEKRANTVLFPYAYQKIDDLVIHCPLGYKAEAVPNPQKVNSGAVSFEISAVPQPDGVKVRRQLTINGTVYPKESYPVLRKFFSMVKSDDSAQVMFQASR